MALARSKYVKEGQEGVYHCFSRCVRRAFLCGYDAYTQRDFSHRKKLLVDRLRYLAAIFAIEVCAYAIMENHYHSILRTRPDIIATWSDHEVAKRWLELFPPKHRKKGKAIPLLEEQISTLLNNPDYIAKLRKRLCSLSWFMGRLNEYMARTANREDQVKGRFWESRFKCQTLLDEAAIVACMAYVDLNPVRAGIAATPEESSFTSIRERLCDWQRQTSAQAHILGEVEQDTQAKSLGGNMQKPVSVDDISSAVQHSAVKPNSIDTSSTSACWLCPIQSDSHRRGILQMTLTEYFDLLDKSGRLIRSDKQGSIDSGLAPILLRIGARPESWLRTVSRFGYEFRIAAGRLPNMRNFADQMGQQWLKGIAMAHYAFASPMP
jgi:REP element-mobilizing transposase RayT